MASSRAKGNRREDACRLVFDALGYAYASLRGSGALSESMKAKLKHHIAGDGLAIYHDPDVSMPAFQVSVGAHTVRFAFEELRSSLLPGFRPMFVQYYYPLGKPKRAGRKRVKVRVAKSRVFLDEDTVFSTIPEAVNAARR